MNTKKILVSISALLLADYLIAQFNSKPRIFTRKMLNNNYNAVTIPPFGVFITEDQKDNLQLIQHELVHWEQYRKTGAIIFFLRYFLQKSLYGYDKMPLEIEARKEVGESNFCLENYTECVRNCDSKTVCNPEFRL